MAELEARKPESERDVLTCAAEWLRDLTRAVKVARLYRAQNPVAIDTRGRLADALVSHLAHFGAWSFRITATEIQLGKDAIIKPAPRVDKSDAAPPSLLEQLPFLFFRDGVRQITFLPGIPAHDVDALIDALIDSWADRGSIDDLVTSLWQANPTHIHLETVPFEQMLYVSTGPGAAHVERGLGLAHGAAPRTEEIRAELGAREGAEGLQRESGFDEEVPEWFASVDEAFAQLRRARAPGVSYLQAQWETERNSERLGLASALFARLVRGPDSAETRAALARYVVTGVAGSIAHTHWDEACHTLELVRQLDADGAVTAGALIQAVAEQSETDLGDSLDEATPNEQARFFAFAVGLGEAGVALALAALAGAKKPRTRAAACTALCYLCCDHPERLADAIGDGRSDVLSGVVSVLGQIGGSGVTPLLALAAQHPNPRIRREVARALAAVPAGDRSSLLLTLVQSPDPLLNVEALKVARLEPDAGLGLALLRLAEEPAFEDRPEEVRSAFYHSVADAGKDAVVPALEQQVTNGNRFARGSWRRSAAAYALARIGSEAARAALDRGSKHPSESVRATCKDALERRVA
jgi:hypothetical protein